MYIVIPMQVSCLAQDAGSPCGGAASKQKPSSGFQVFFLSGAKRTLGRELSSGDPEATEINWKVYLEHPETAFLFCNSGCLDGFANALGQV